ncbi:MAG: DNA mismatch repair endonuclease MutL [Bacteroidia bacterium]
MSDIIRLLPDSIANQIAAGEVVQRPASVVKELLENAIDAEADKIQLFIRDAGTTFIQVKDNGKGMSETDARMCWERHATSKIKKADDLFSLKTFGFRGEALASIAAVSQVEMKTRREEDSLGTELKIEASEVLHHEPVNCPNGTSIIVKNLFFNIPARRNFLKSPSIETRHIYDEFNRVSLANPQIEFSFFLNDNETINLQKTDLKHRIIDLLGKKEKGEFLELNETTDILKITGFVGSPEYAKRIRGDQFLFVNGRFIKEPYFNHAIQTAFQGLIPEDFFPYYVVFFEMDPSKIDVNVHPTKTEVKFEDSKIIYSILRSVIKKSLGNYTLTPQMEDNRIFNFETSTLPENEVISHYNSPKINTKYNPFSTDIQPNKRQDWGKVLDQFKRPEPNFYEGGEKSNKIPVEPESQLFLPEEKLTFDGIFQLAGGYIICSKNHELFLINQQAAHERVLYDQFSRQFENHTIPVQTLLFPRMAEFNAADFSLVYSLIEEIKMLGFDISAFGKNTFIINGVPAINDKTDPQAILEGLIDNYRQNEQKLHLDKKENLARSMARNAAMRGSENLTLIEMEELLSQLFNSPQPNFLPNGKPVFIKISQQGLAEMFGR